jgi:peptide/nickel transport system permease protein
VGLRPVVVSFALFLFRRLLGIVVLIWVVTLAAFGLFRLGVPSQLADRQINVQLGQGEPASWQYAHYLLRLLHGNFGQSLTIGLPVSTVLWRALPPTLSLLIGGMLLWLAVGVIAGMISALRAGSAVDKIVTGATMTVAIVPTFLIALLLLAVFTYIARTGFLWMQPGYVPLTRDPGAWLGRMILPWIALAATQAGLTARLTRTSVLEVLSEDYVRTARAKGLSTRRVIWCHVLRPSLVPLIHSVSVGVGTLLGSAVIIDQAFTLGGVGQTFLLAAKANDLMVVMGTVLITVILVSLANLIADICQAVLDPRTAPEITRTLPCLLSYNRRPNPKTCTGARNSRRHCHRTHRTSHSISGPETQRRCSNPEHSCPRRGRRPSRPRPCIAELARARRASNSSRSRWPAHSRVP